MTEPAAPQADEPGVGQALAGAREAQGMSIADVAQILKFAPRQLEALEAERFEALPGATVTRGMLRNYARLLKLDAEPLLARIAGRFPAPDAGRLATRYSEPVPFSDSARRSTATYLALSCGVLVLVGVVAYEWHKEANAPAAAAFVSPASSPEAPRALAMPAQVASLSNPAAPMPDLVKMESAAPPPAQDPEPQVQKPLVGGGRIVLRCEREAWIEVRDGTGKLLASSLNPAGSERVVQGRPPFSLVIGNASHVRVTYDDRPVDLQPHVKVEVARLTLK